MQIPRRVPWASLAELERVCEWIYSPDSTPADRQRALHRLSAWSTTTTLPSSLLSTLALLTSLSLDTPTTPLPSLALRQSYALSLIRLVNSLVDPLQQGMYARPIAHIARQLGLPGWWVELRHMGTHEELPGLPVLREAAREALDWLYTHYFLPTLHRSSPTPYPTNSHSMAYPSPAPLLKEYKTLSKTILRDASLASKMRGQMDSLLRGWERWVGEVRVGLSTSWGGVGGSAGGEREELERATLECVCEGLLEKGGLVPVSRKKRPSSKNPQLPAELAGLWARLLQHTQANHPLFVPILYSSLLTHLASPPTDEGGGDSSVDSTLVGWAGWLVQTFPDELGGRAETLAQACLALGEAEEGRRGALSGLVRMLAEGEGMDAVGGKVESLLSVVGGGRVSGWEEGDVELMERRLRTLEETLKPKAPVLVAQAVEDVEMLPPEEEAPGWRRLTGREWRECPIGVVGA